MPKNVSFVLFLRLFCVKDSYNFNTNKHFNTLFFPFSHILYQWLTLRRVFPFLKIVVYMTFHNAIVLYPTANLMKINDIHKLITLLRTFNSYKTTLLWTFNSYKATLLWTFNSYKITFLWTFNKKRNTYNCFNRIYCCFAIHFCRFA